jgi:C_GCAxxG_C_C family probable redox protein
MKKSQVAIENFKSLNCAQSVLLTYAQEVNLEEKKAMAIAIGFGSGMTMGETCGAVTGAYMVLGLKIRTEGKTYQDIKTESKANIGRFNELFMAKHGSLQCKKLLGIDLSTPEGMQQAREEGLFDTVCATLVGSAAEILQENF